MPKNKYWHYDETLNAIDNNSNISAPTVSLTRNCRYNVSIDSLSLPPYPILSARIWKWNKYKSPFSEENKFNSFKYFDNNVDTKLYWFPEKIIKLGKTEVLTSFNRDWGSGQQLAEVPRVIRVLIKNPRNFIDNSAGLGWFEPCTTRDYIVWCWNEESN